MIKILVCISNVPDTTAKITFTDNNTKLNTTGIQFILNPYDEIALARAVELTDGGNGTVTVINVGEAATEPTIRRALAIGASDAVRIDAKPNDAWFVAYQIAQYIKKNSFDLILTGRESIDYNGAKVAGMIGELLEIPSVSVIKKLIIDGDGATVEREIEGGTEMLTIPLPFIAGTAEGVAEPKIPNMRGLMAARTKPLTVIEPASIQTFSAVISYETPVPRGNVKLIPGEDTDRLVALLHTEARVL